MGRRTVLVGGPLLAVLLLVGVGAGTWAVWSEQPDGPAAQRWLPSAPVRWSGLPDDTRGFSGVWSVVVAGRPGPAARPDRALLAAGGHDSAAPPDGLVSVTESLAAATAAGPDSRSSSSRTDLDLDAAGVHTTRYEIDGEPVDLVPAELTLQEGAVLGSTWSSESVLSAASLGNYLEPRGTLRSTFTVIAADSGCLDVAAEHEQVPPDGGDPMTSRGTDRWCPGGWRTRLTVDDLALAVPTPEQVRDALVLFDRSTGGERPGVVNPAAPGSPPGAEITDTWPAFGQQLATNLVVAPGARPRVVAADAGAGELRAWDESGVLVWAAQLPDGVRVDPVATSGGAVVAVDATGGVWAFDTASGVVRWQQAVGGHATRVAVSGDRVAVGFWDGRVVVLDAVDGTPRGTADLGSPVRGLVADVAGTGWWTTAEDGGWRHVDLGAVVGTTLDVGAVRWDGALAAVPTSGGELVVAAAADGAVLRRLVAADGAVTVLLDVRPAGPGGSGAARVTPGPDGTVLAWDGSRGAPRCSAPTARSR
ncbi:outer membrane protein assembly factor BamB family protein [Nakamurella alba]|uniref:outer membrane protein assembly factor BamB family protein n=1 Tax=Nakamurella alba TaxID=2665158 RepID=UPI0018AC62FA|nr:PQQ-binding-like beta-propeller repeat protein [Nakamurella alba]